MMMMMMVMIGKALFLYICGFGMLKFLTMHQ